MKTFFGWAMPSRSKREEEEKARLKLEADRAATKARLEASRRRFEHSYTPPPRRDDSNDLLNPLNPLSPISAWNHHGTTESHTTMESSPYVGGGGSYGGGGASASWSDDSRPSYSSSDSGSSYSSSDSSSSSSSGGSD